MACPTELPAIVLDGGSSLFKAGFAGDEIPSVVIQSVVGKHKESDSGFENAGGMEKVKGLVGKEVRDKQESLTLHYPINRGIVTNWDDLELLWAHCFQELHIDPEDHGIVMSDPPLNPRSNREKILELMFEAFRPAGFHLANSGQLVLYTSGRHTGIVTDIGDGVTSAVPFYESFCFSNAVQRQDFGGRDLTFYLQKLLYEKGHIFTTPAELQFVQELKENTGYVTSEYIRDLKISDSSLKKCVSLPDGNSVMLDSERVKCPEALFNPSLAGFPYLKGLPDLIESSLLNCDIDVRADICVNFIISGGCSLFPGLADRLKAELKKKFPRSRVHVVPMNPALYGAWIGGSILGSLSMFQYACITKQDYDEHGPSLLYRY